MISENIVYQKKPLEQAKSSHKKNKTIHSWLAFIIGISSAILTGIFKHFMSGYPDQVVIGAITAITIAYFGKRITQKHKSFRQENNFNNEAEAE